MIFLAVRDTNARLDSLVCDTAVPQLQNKIASVVSEAINSVVPDEDFVRVVRSPDGKILSVESDTRAVNLYRAAVTEEISRRLSELSEYYVRISLANVFDDEVILGNFPELRLRASVEPNGSVETSVRDSLTSAGINQTLHRIELSVTVDVKALLLISTVDVSSVTNVCIAETVIVGDVPSVFLSDHIPV